MTISSLSSLGSQAASLAFTSSQSISQQKKLDFQQLFQSLQNSNLGGARQAYSALEQLISATGASQQSAANTQPGAQNDPFSTDLKAVGLALKSGDLAGAQQAFAQLRQDLQAYRQSHHHPHGATQAMATGAAAAAYAGDGDGDGSLLNVTV